MDFTQSCLSDLTTLWGQFGMLEKQKFRKTYGDIASLISVPIEELVRRAVLRFWDPSYRCFTFGKEELVPTVEVPSFDGNRSSISKQSLQ